MAKGTGTYDDPILVDGLFSKTINGVKKFFKIKTGSSVDTSQFVKKSGDTLNGNYFFSDGCNLYKTNKTSTLRLNASNDGKDGARLVLCGKDTKDYPAEFNLCANDGTSDIQLIGKANGELYWNNKNIVRTVNGAVADTNGNVNIIESGNQYIRFSDGIQICYITSLMTEQLRQTYLLPKPFIDTNYCAVANDTTDDAGNSSFVKVAVYNLSTTAIQILTDKGISKFACIVIGRWK